MEFLKRAVNWYRNDLKLSYKLLLSHLALILAFMVAVAALFQSTLYDTLISNTINSKQKITFSTVNSLEFLLKSPVYNADALTAALNRAMFREQGGTPAGEKDAVSLDPSITTGVRIYVTPQHEYLLNDAAVGSYCSPVRDVAGTYWYGVFSEGYDHSYLFCPGLYLSPQETEKYGDLAYIRQVEDPGTGEVAAYVAVYFSQEPINGALKKNLDISGGASYIINDGDALVCDSDSELVGAYYIDNDRMAGIIKQDEHFGTMTYMGEKIIVGYYVIGGTDWKIVTVYPQKYAAAEARRAVVRFFSIYLIVALLGSALSIRLARSISGRLSTVVRQMGSVRNARPERIESLPPARDEIGQFVGSYNDMVDDMNRLMDRESEAAKTLRLSEFNALQAQINPHFLYNSLDMINWLAMAGEQKQVSAAIQSLSKFYKLTLSRKDTFGTVGNELEHVTLYVSLQNMRYENRINFIVDVDENIRNCAMPRMIFQPLVENAILHGIMERESKTGTIILAGWRDGNDLVFLISDDGVGMTEEQAAQILRADAAREGAKGSGIGIYNTQERLQLYYGPDYGLRYRSTAGQGTEVEVRIPCSGGAQPA